MKTYQYNDLATSKNIVDEIINLVNTENSIFISGIGAVNIDNVELVCNAINATLEYSSSIKKRKVQKKRTEEQDMLILEYYKTHTIVETSRFFEVPTSTISNVARRHGFKKGRKSC